ncbi:MAG: NAD(P)/FAD-dependent oxidoreductase [Pseudomonadota bacterium]
MIGRRALLRYASGVSGASAATLAGLAGCASTGSARPRIVIVGGGFGGATCARTLRVALPSARITLIVREATYTACPFSNLVIAGLRELPVQQFGYATLAALGIEVRIAAARDVDAARRSVTLANGERLTYDRLVLSPGIDVDYAALPGYDRAASERLPHAWQAGAQTLLLREQLRAMPADGLVVMTIPENPYRCPPGPYERASLIAHYLRTHKPGARLLLLDAKDRFSKMSLFRAAWRERYGDRLQWLGAADGARVIGVDADARRVFTDFDEYAADVINVVPPQKAGAIAARAGVADASGWCPVYAATFAATLAERIHVIGDAAIANAMPKSAFAANAQGRLVGLQIARLLGDQEPLDTTLLNTCYSLVAPDYGISVAGVYRPNGERWAEVPGAGGTSPLDAPAASRALEARYARDWFTAITRDVFG